MPFLETEDRALKRKLQGLKVHDATSGSGRPVTVRYKNPEYELADSVYPLVLLSHTRISKDEERESRGVTHIGYAPEGFDPWADMTKPGDSPYYAETPIPMNIDYQVDLYTRKQLHMIELTPQLMSLHFLPPRFGYLAVPEDGTVRRLDILGGPEYFESKDELGKRLFSASWSIQVSAEIFLYEIKMLTPVLKRFLEVEQIIDGPLVPLE
jgi:hypothetical protein